MGFDAQKEIAAMRSEIETLKKEVLILKTTLVVSAGETLFRLKLKKYRQRKKMSHPELAEYLGVHRSTIASWESGKSMPDRDMLLRLAYLMDDFLEEIEPDPTEVVEALLQVATPIKLADRMGVDRRTIDRWRKGVRPTRPNREKLVSLAKLWGKI